MPDWKAVVLARFDSSPRPPAEVVDEIAQHAEALFQRSRSEGASDEQATALVEQELADCPNSSAPSGRVVQARGRCLSQRVQA